MIEEGLDIELGEDEGGFIGMHMINGEVNEEMNRRVNMRKEVNGIVTIVKYDVNMEFDEE
ncbi:hypothetical protein [Bacillus pumilus]|uniref:hypothetical protein n=1 Tax=Bacillus pumilus TaxID=1408 RepID=UPI0011A98C80|nr:hypothetical protein [Bacillus pumilus]